MSTILYGLLKPGVDPWRSPCILNESDFLAIAYECEGLFFWISSDAEIIQHHLAFSTYLYHIYDGKIIGNTMLGYLRPKIKKSFSIAQFI